jgi:hypothetical protein
MTHQELPEGYAVIQLAKSEWYPLRVERVFSAMHPDGFLLPQFLGQDIHFSRRKEAVAHCQEEATLDEQIERSRWERLAVKSDVYPERCAQYRHLIEEITGSAPLVQRFYDEVAVYVPGYVCTHCRGVHDQIVKKELVIEEALAACAEAVYASQQACMHQVSEDHDGVLLISF